MLLEHYFKNLEHTVATGAPFILVLITYLSKKAMVRRFSSLFFRQSQDRVVQAAADNVQAGASRPGVSPNPLQRTDFPRKTVRHIKSSGALLGTLRSLQYNTQPPPPLPTHSARGLGDLQECFWLEDGLKRTTAQLDRCSSQLDQIHGSAAEVRQELEGLQVELGLLQKKMQLGMDPVKGEEATSGLTSGPKNEIQSEPKSELRSEPSNDPRTESKKESSSELKNESRSETRTEQPKLVDAIPKRPAIVKATSIQQRIQFFSKIASG